MNRPRLSTKQRKALWDAHRYADDSGCPCALCPRPIRPGESWEAAHIVIPHAHGGTVMKPAHARCHRYETATITIPLIARVKRMRERFLDLRRSRKPLPGGRDDPRKRTMGGMVVSRETGERWGGRQP
jgi:hypothetical protein